MNLNGMIAQMQMGQPSGPGPSGVSAPKAKAPGNPVSHLKAAHSAAKSGDHKKAKHHAFAAIKAMPRAAVPDADPTSTPAPGGTV